VTDPASRDALANQLQRLERAGRRNQVVVFALAVLLIFVAFVLPMLRQEIAAERFVLKSAGVVRGSLAATSDGTPALSLYDAQGMLRMNLSMRADGSPDVVLNDSDGTVRAALRLSGDGVPSLFFVDASGDLKAVMGVPNDGLPALVLLGDQGQVQYMTPY
jgi:hypothetical protein